MRDRVAEPELSIVVVGSGALAPRLLSAVAKDLETGLVEVVAVSGDAAIPDSPGAHGVRWVRCPPGTVVPRLRAAGLREARAPLVALTEAFCLPAPGWAAAVLRAHAATDAVAVGGPVSRETGTAVAWGLTFIEYGRFMRREPAGPVDDVPGINVTYRRERLRTLLGSLPDEVFEVDLHRQIRDRGGVLWREPGAVMLDANAVPLGAAIRAQFQHGRLFGGRRVRGGGPAIRLLRFVLSPAVPFVLAARISREARAAGRGPELRRAAGSLALFLLAWAAGEAVGSLFGDGDSGHWRA